MFFNIVADGLLVAVIVVGAHALLLACARRRRPQVSGYLSSHPGRVWVMLTLAVLGIKLTAEVFAKGSGPADEAILWLIRDHVPAALTGFFAVVTITGSAVLLLPLAGVATLALLITRRRAEAVLLGSSVITATAVVWSIKAIVGRTRPALWEAHGYWGSSFPSGHTLNTAAFTVGAALCLAQIWPRTASPAMALAVLWTGLVGVSRLVLGVHWPTDVLAGLCLGGFIPLFISAATGRHSRRHRAQAP